jgi:hypothetical protein
MTTLDQLESRLKSLLEDKLLQSLPGLKAEDQVAQRLAAVMHENLKVQNGEKQAPNMYVVVAHPSILERWKAQSNLLKELSQALYQAGTESGFVFHLRPSVTTAADAKLPAETIRILASFSSESIADTNGISLDQLAGANPVRIPKNAFMILEGTKIIPLDKAVMNIGRRLDNQIVITDPRVSRNHAQLRIVRDRFVIFDLNSSGGLYVNGHRTNQCVLYPGDVISLAGVNLLFGHDIDTDRLTDGSKGESGSPFSADYPTAILDPTNDK